MRAALLLPALLPILLVAGCGGGLLAPSGPPPALYTLQAPATVATTAGDAHWQLLVEAPEATLDINNTRIAVAPTPTRIDYFAGVAWADRPPSMLQAVLVESFDRSGRIGAVERQSGGLRSDFMLATDLDDFQAEAGPNGTQAHVRITARLIRSRDRSIVAARTFETSIDVGLGIESAIGGFDRAVETLVPEIVDWTLNMGNRNP
jgi:cholesterol transport system auxiliary component